MPKIENSGSINADDHSSKIANKRVTKLEDDSSKQANKRAAKFEDDFFKQENKRAANVKDDSFERGTASTRSESEKYEFSAFSSRNVSTTRTPVFKMHFDIRKGGKERSRKHASNDTCKCKCKCKCISNSSSPSPRGSSTVILLRPKDKLNVTVEMESVSVQTHESKLFNRSLTVSESDESVHKRERRNRYKALYKRTCKSMSRREAFVTTCQQFWNDIDKYSAKLDTHLCDLKGLLKNEIYTKPQMKSVSIQTNEEEILDYIQFANDMRYTKPDGTLLGEVENFVTTVELYTRDFQEFLRKVHANPKLRTLFCYPHENEIFNNSFVVGDSKILQPSKNHSEGVQTVQRCEFCMLNERRRFLNRHTS